LKRTAKLLICPLRETMRVDRDIYDKNIRMKLPLLVSAEMIKRAGKLKPEERINEPVT
jgi:hypothetical protein